jgi:glutaredoxin
MLPPKRTRPTMQDYLPQILPWLIVAVVAAFLIRFFDRPIEVFPSDAALLRFKIEAGIPQHHEIILLVTEWCPACKSLQNTLAERGVPFSLLDVEASAQGAHLYGICVSKGAAQSIPKVIFRREMISQPDLFKRLLL